MYTYITWLFVIIKEWPPRALPMEEEVVVHIVLECGANIEDQANNDPMEANDDDNNTVEEDGTHRLI